MKPGNRFVCSAAAAYTNVMVLIPTMTRDSRSLADEKALLIHAQGLLRSAIDRKRSFLIFMN